MSRGTRSSGPKTGQGGLLCGATKTVREPVVKQEFKSYFGLNCRRRKRAENSSRSRTSKPANRCFFPEEEPRAGRRGLHGFIVRKTEAC